MKKLLKKIFPFFKKKNLRKFKIFLSTIGHRNNLNKLAQIYGCDKWDTHLYTLHYMEHFKKNRLKKINLLEIGVGGYEYPDCGGESLRMWKSYFPFGKIFSIDIYDKSPIQENRIKIFQGNQIDKEFLHNVIETIGRPNIIIDDGSHINEHVIETFKILFPVLKENGIYVIEDTQTSYWPSFGGNSENLNANTIMNFFKKISDGLNHKEYLISNYNPSYFDLNIVSVHFYHNLIFIYKGNNNEASNCVTDGMFIKNKILK